VHGGNIPRRDIVTLRNRKAATNETDRRGFLKVIAASGGVALGAGLLEGCSSGITLDLTKPANQALSTVGGTIALDANSIDPDGILVVRDSETSVKAFSRRCMHAHCVIAPFQGGVSTCPCHGSQYDTAGKAVHGPSKEPLVQHKAVLSGTTVTISA
jgi:nitrite reductase/ring-hydroxylating ferredoxin subunit